MPIPSPPRITTSDTGAVTSVSRPVSRLLGLRTLFDLLALGADPGPVHLLRSLVPTQRPGDERQATAARAALGAGARGEGRRQPGNLRRHRRPSYTAEVFLGQHRASK